MKLTPEELARIASLAELELGPDEVGPLARQLESIVDYVGQLERLTDLASADPFLPGLQSVELRPDEGGSVPLARPPAKFAPDFHDGFFLVPRLPAMDAE